MEEVTQEVEIKEEPCYWEAVSSLVEALPIRATSGSAAYDIVCPEEVAVAPGELKIVDLGVAIRLPEKHHLELVMRSSMAMNGLIMPGGFGVIDADYYPRPVKAILFNISNKDIFIPKGARVVQGLIVQHRFVQEDTPKQELREGGMGSTGVA